MSVSSPVVFDAAKCPEHLFETWSDETGMRRCTHEGCHWVWVSPDALAKARAGIIEAMAVIAGKSDRYQSLVPMTPGQPNEDAMIAAATAWQQGCNDIWERLQAAVLNDSENTRVLSIPSRLHEDDAAGPVAEIDDDSIVTMPDLPTSYETPRRSAMKGLGWDWPKPYTSMAAGDGVGLPSVAPSANGVTEVSFLHPDNEAAFAQAMRARQAIMDAAVFASYPGIFAVKSAPEPDIMAATRDIARGS